MCLYIRRTHAHAHAHAHAHTLTPVSLSHSHKALANGADVIHRGETHTQTHTDTHYVFPIHTIDMREYEDGAFPKLNPTP